MKKSISGMLVLLAGASVVYGQGAVSLGDFGSAISPSYLYISYAPKTGPSVMLGGSATGPAATLSNYALETGDGNDWTVALAGAVGSGLSSNSLSFLPGELATFGTGPTASGGNGNSIAGTWGSTAIYQFAGAASGTVATLQLYAWYNDGGTITSFATALADGVPTGMSSTANVSLVAPPSPPAALPDGLGNFSVTAPIPEPSTIALGLIGASTFLMRLRRKQ